MGYGLLGLVAALLTRETWGRAERDEVAALERSLTGGTAVPTPRTRTSERQLTSGPTTD
jgi:hypothetical protein